MLATVSDYLFWHHKIPFAMLRPVAIALTLIGAVSAQSPDADGRYTIRANGIKAQVIGSEEVSDKWC